MKKIKIEPGRSNATCDFCLTKGEVYVLRSNYRKYRFMNVCKKCLNAIRSGFEKS